MVDSQTLDEIEFHLKNAKDTQQEGVTVTLHVNGMVKQVRFGTIFALDFLQSP